MANEFVARKGLIVLSNGAKITGSVGIQGNTDATGYAVTASYFVGDGSYLTNIASSLNFSGSSGGSDVLNLKTDTLTFSGSNGLLANVTDNTVTFTLPSGTVSASSQVNYAQLSNVPAGIVSSSTQVTTLLPAGTVSSSGQIDHNATTNYVANEHIDHSTVNISAGFGLSGGGSIATSRTLTLDTSSAHFVSGTRKTISATNTTGASGVNLTYNEATGVISGSLVNSSITVNGQTIALGGSGTVTANTTNALTLGNGLTGTSFDGSSAVTATVDTASTHFTDGVKAKLNIEGVISSSTQIAAIGYATTASNTFTGIQTITDDTNSTNYTNGALVVAGGVGIAKDVNISGSLTVTGLLTAVSMSTQYVTSSQYTIGTSRVIVNDDDLVRFAGLSVIDSGSTYGTGSLLWDSFHNRWIYEADDQAYSSAIIIAGPKNTGSLGEETGLIPGRIPVATGDDHIDTAPTISPLRVEGLTLHVEENVFVTGSVTASSFAGDGSNLTGIVTELALTGSDGGTGTVSLKTQALTVDGTNGVTATVSGQTITISGSNATTTSIGVASFTGSNFTVTGGQVSSNPINFNGANINLGGTHAFGLQNITPYGASTSDRVTLSGGAIIDGVLYTSDSNLDIDTGTEVIASIPTGSYDAAHFDYVAKKSGNLRTGTVMVVWQSGTANIEYTDTSTNDIGNTNEVLFTADTLLGNVRLLATVSSTDWAVKAAARLI